MFARFVKCVVTGLVALAVALAGLAVIGGSQAATAAVAPVATVKQSAERSCKQVCKPKKPPKCKPKKPCKNKVTIVRPARPYVEQAQCVPGQPGQITGGSIVFARTPGVVYSLAGGANPDNLAPGVYTVIAKATGKKTRYRDAAGFVGGKLRVVIADPGDCKVQAAEPSITATTPTCTSQNMVVTPRPGQGYTWNRGRTILRPGQSVTFVATPSDGYFLSGNRSNVTVDKTNTLKPATCKSKKKCVKKHNHKNHDKPRHHKPKKKPCKC